MKKLVIVFIMALVVSVCFFGCGDKNESGGITGDIVDVSGSSIEIATTDGENYQFSLDQLSANDIADGEQLNKGDNVSVYYTGELDDDNLVQVVTVTNVRLNTAAVQPSESNNTNNNTNSGENTTGNTTDNNNTRIVEGVVVDASMENVTIKAKDGNNYTFNKENATVNLGDDGLVIGEDILITYLGELNPNQELEAISIGED